MKSPDLAYLQDSHSPFSTLNQDSDREKLMLYDFPHFCSNTKINRRVILCSFTAITHTGQGLASC